jgi:hypothetical protein
MPPGSMRDGEQKLELIRGTHKRRQTIGLDMRYTQARDSGSPRPSIPRYSLRFFVLALLVCSSQFPIFAVGASAASLLEEIEASEKARLAAQADLQYLRDCIRKSGANQELEQTVGSWTFDFSVTTYKEFFGKSSFPCLDVQCRVTNAQDQLNDFAAAQIAQDNRLLKEIAELHERLNNIALCIK